VYHLYDLHVIIGGLCQAPLSPRYWSVPSLTLNKEANTQICVQVTEKNGLNTLKPQKIRFLGECEEKHRLSSFTIYRRKGSASMSCENLLCTNPLQFQECLPTAHDHSPAYIQFCPWCLIQYPCSWRVIFCYAL